MKEKTSIRYYYKTPIRSRFDYKNKKWWYAASDVILALTGSNNSRRYWNTLKDRNKDLSLCCNQAKLKARDGKFYMTDVIDEEGAKKLLLKVRSNETISFMDWIKGLANPLDEESRVRAYELYDNIRFSDNEIGTVENLKKIHKYLFDGLYSFAGQIRQKNISKDGFQFANCNFIYDIMDKIEHMGEKNLKDIINKYIEMNIAHPFMEGNGRATRIWLDLILKKNLNAVVDWSLIAKEDYLQAMRESPTNSNKILKLIKGALTSNCENREIYMKGIDYSYYYEEID